MSGNQHVFGNSNRGVHSDSNLGNLCINGSFVVNVDNLHNAWTKRTGVSDFLICDMWMVLSNIPDFEIRHFNYGVIGFRGTITEEGPWSLELENLNRYSLGTFETENNYDLTASFSVRVDRKNRIALSMSSTPRSHTGYRVGYAEPETKPVYGQGLGPMKNRFNILGSATLDSGTVIDKGMTLSINFGSSGYFEFYVFGAREFFGLYHDEPVYAGKNPVEELMDVRTFYESLRDGWVNDVDSGILNGWGTGPFPWYTVNGFDPYEVHDNLIEVDSGTYRHLTADEVQKLTGRPGAVGTPQGPTVDASDLHHHDSLYPRNTIAGTINDAIDSLDPNNHNHDDDYYLRIDQFPVPANSATDVTYSEQQIIDLFAGTSFPLRHVYWQEFPSFTNYSWDDTLYHHSMVDQYTPVLHTSSEAVMVPTLNGWMTTAYYKFFFPTSGQVLNSVYPSNIQGTCPQDGHMPIMLYPSFLSGDMATAPPDDGYSNAESVQKQVGFCAISANGGFGWTHVLRIGDYGYFAAHTPNYATVESSFTGESFNLGAGFDRVEGGGVTTTIGFIEHYFSTYGFTIPVKAGVQSIKLYIQWYWLAASTPANSSFRLRARTSGIF